MRVNFTCEQNMSQILLSEKNTGILAACMVTGHAQ